jgi:hypothetical protein
MLEKLHYRTTGADGYDCVDLCPYKPGEYIGSGFCSTFCEKNYSDDYDEERHQGYVICDTPNKETK